MLGRVRSVILCVGVTLVWRVFKYIFTNLSIQIFNPNLLQQMAQVVLHQTESWVKFFD